MNDTSDLASIVLLAVYAFIFILYLYAIYRHRRGLYPPKPQEAEKKNEVLINIFKEENTAEAARQDHDCTIGVWELRIAWLSSSLQP